MKFFKAEYEAPEEIRERIRNKELPALYDEFDKRVMVIPLARKKSNEKCTFFISVIMKNGNATADQAKAYVNKALKSWDIKEISFKKLHKCTASDCFDDDSTFDYPTIRSLRAQLNLAPFLGAMRGSNKKLKEWLFKPYEKEKALELVEDTYYSEALTAELNNIFDSNEETNKPKPSKSKNASSVKKSTTSLPITYIVEGNAPTEATEITSLLLGALLKNERISSPLAFYVDIDSFYSDFSYFDDSEMKEFFSPQLIKLIEGNTLVLRYGAYDDENGHSSRIYGALTTLFELIKDACSSTQLVLSIPEQKDDLLLRLKRRLDTPVTFIGKNNGTSVNGNSYEANLNIMKQMATQEDLELDADAEQLLLKRMRQAQDQLIEIESVYAEWKSYKKAKETHPQYASVINEAIQQDVSCEEEGAFARLNSLIGLQPVKQTMSDFLKRISMNKMLTKQGLKPFSFSMHMVFKGSPGTGKTEVAKLFAEILKEQHILKEGRLVMASGSDIKIKKAFEEAKGSVLFIDEAYELSDFTGQIAELIAHMEQNRKDTVVILAGYDRHMDALLSKNPGFRSRIGFELKFPDYSFEELEDIFYLMCEQHQFVLSKDAKKVARDAIQRGGRRNDQGNARFIRKMFENTVGKQQVRLARMLDEDTIKTLTRDDLREITANDIKEAVKLEDPSEVSQFKTGREELDSLIGLQEVKHEINSYLNMAKFQSIRRDYGIKTPFVPLHMAFMGNPGTGKTEVARLVGRILREEGVLSVGEFIECRGGDLMSSFSGASEDAVRNLFQNARGSVVFIDEAYSLANPGGKEAVTSLIAEMENLRDEVVVIFAGYTDEIKHLFEMNAGFKSRVRQQVIFPDYSPEELLKILHRMIDLNGFKLTGGVDNKVLGIFEKAVRMKDFGNGRFARGLFEEALIRQSNRLEESGKEKFSKKELLQLKPEDFEFTSEGTEQRMGFV